MAPPDSLLSSMPPESQDRPVSDRTDDRSPPFRYTATLAAGIETRWQEYWDRHQTFRTPNPGEPGFDASRPKFYCLDMFPYPSGAGLHVGHPEGYTATDIVCRYRRMKGFNVLHPMGWDAFGLPAEQYAIQTGIHPAITTRNAIETFRRQLKRFGFSYDWSREFGTIDPDYYKWTQWIFLRLYDAWFDRQAGRGGKARPIRELLIELESGDLRVNSFGELVHVGPSAASMSPLGTDPVGTRRWHELSRDEQRRTIDDHRLAYIAESVVNWCPKLGTVLANDEVIDGRSERGGHPVLRKPLRQWMFRITAYAQRLLDDLDSVDWPESTRTMQREWIGRSDGAEIEFEIEHPSIVDRLTVFTTRPDTLFGATYMVVAPEHPLIERIIDEPGIAGIPEPTVRAVREYATWARNRSDVERQESREKTGVFTGLHALNPATGRKIPVWTADYVLMGYGHGAIMAVPAHDERDFEFAQRFGLPIRDVVHSRAHAAMAYFAGAAQAEERSDERFAGTLADLLGVVTSDNTAPHQFEAALREVRTRRSNAAAGTAVVLGSQGPDSHQAGGVGRQRGSTHIQWLDTLEALGITRFDTLEKRVREASFCASAAQAYSAPGFAANSRNAQVSLDGLPTDEAARRIVAWLEDSGCGRARTQYRLRDWTFSRQRYWGEPFPIVFDERGSHYPVSASALPVILPELADYAPEESDDPRPLLAKAASWVKTTAGAAGVDPSVLPPETPVTRETNTMPGSAGSSWYCVRYCDPRNRDRFVGKEAERYWMVSQKKNGQDHAGGVDLYIGGSEHAVGHLLYARFWHKVLFDLGELSTPEPFGRLFHQGMITAYSYQRADKHLVPLDQVEEVSDGVFAERATGQRLTPVIAKMSKTLKNVVNPDDIIAQFSADTFRVYEMYMGPLDASKPWNTRDTVGMFRFLQRLWRLAVDEADGSLRVSDQPDPAIERLLHRTIAKVDADIPKLAFNTAISSIIEFVNAATSACPRGLTSDQLGRLALVLSPFAPHMAEEIWSKLGRQSSLAKEPFPAPDPAMLVDEAVEVPVQIGGKVRARISIRPGHTPQELETAAMADPGVQAAIEGRPVRKVVAVPGRMVNIVVG